MIHGKLNKISNATSGWQSFDVAPQKTQEVWTENQYRTEWSSSIVNETLDKTVTNEKVTAKPPKDEFLKTSKILNKFQLKPIIYLPYRGNIIQTFARRMKKIV